MVGAETAIGLELDLVEPGLGEIGHDTAVRAN